MSSELRTIWRDSRIYGLGSLLNRFAGLLLIPVILHSVPAEEWGIYVLVLAVTGLIAVPAIALIDTMVRLYFENDDAVRRRQVVSSIMAVFSFISLIFAAVSVPLASLLGTLILGHQDYYSVFLIGLLAMIADLLIGIVLDYLRIRKWPAVFVAVTLLRSIGQFALTLLLVIGFDLGVLGVVIGNFAAATLVALPMALFILFRVGWAPDRGIVREILKLGLPLIPAWLSKSAAPLLERQILNVLSGPGSVGIFALGARLSEQLGVLMQGPFSDVWSVRLMEIGQDPTKAKAFNRVFLYFLMALTSAALGLALYAPEVVRLLSAPDYWAAMTIVPILALAQVGTAINYHFEVCLLQVKRTHCLAVINGSCLLVAGGLLYTLTTSYGIMGAAAAVLLVQLYRLCASVWFTARCSAYVRLFPWRSAGLLLAFAIGAYLLAMGLGGQEVAPLQFGLKAVIFLVFLAAVFISPVLGPEERSATLDAIRVRLLFASRTPGR